VEYVVVDPPKPSSSVNGEKNDKKKNLGISEKRKKKKSEEFTREKNNNKQKNVTTMYPCLKTYDPLSSSIENGDCPTPPAQMLRANESSAKTNNFRVYSHNVHGLRDETKLEYIPRIMKNNNLDAYLIQETHLAGDFDKYLMFDYYLIHHGPEVQPANGAKGGVAIILTPDLTTIWKASGKAKKCIKGGLSIGNTTRFLSINLRFKMSEENLNICHSLSLTTVYFPHSGYKDKELKNFDEDTSNFLSCILA
jgi:hypothetical protein